MRRPDPILERPGRGSALTAAAVVAVFVIGCPDTAEVIGPAEDTVPATDGAGDSQVADVTGGVGPDPAQAPILGPPSSVDLDRYDPQLYRVDEISLSGEWSFQLDPAGDGESRGLHLPEAVSSYEQNIEVPLPWQSSK